MKKNFAFTMVEMLLVITIMSVFLGVTLFYTRDNESILVLNRALNQLSSDLARARTLSLGLSGGNTTQKACGWGIYIPRNSNSYYLFVDLIRKDRKCSESDHRWSGDSETVEKINFEKGVYISAKSFSSVLFVPPNPDAIFDGEVSRENGLLTVKAGKFSERLTITKSGQISFNNFMQVSR